VKICENCNSLYEDNKNFCKVCGSRLIGSLDIIRHDETISEEPKKLDKANQEAMEDCIPTKTVNSEEPKEEHEDKQLDIEVAEKIVLLEEPKEEFSEQSINTIEASVKTTPFAVQEREASTGFIETQSNIDIPLPFSR
jgi:hypothetical protein